MDGRKAGIKLGGTRTVEAESWVESRPGCDLKIGEEEAAPTHPQPSQQQAERRRHRSKRTAGRGRRCDGAKAQAAQKIGS